MRGERSPSLRALGERRRASGSPGKSKPRLKSDARACIEPGIDRGAHMMLC